MALIHCTNILVILLREGPHVADFIGLPMWIETNKRKDFQ